VLGISGGDPAFRDDDGSADLVVAAALSAFAAGQASEKAALTALAASRLLVPVVAVLADQLSPEGAPPAAEAPPPDGPAGTLGGPGGGEKASEMAMPTLIGLDGRRAVPAFTSLDSMHRWQEDARPVPVAAQHVWQVAIEDACAVVIDVAGPVPLAVEGARLAALARGEPAPSSWSDPDVQEVVADALAGMLDIAAFELRPGDGDCDLVIALTLAPGSGRRGVTELATQIASSVMARLGGRLRRGVAIWLGT
jgi:SseB protein N-terminal domain